MFKNQKILCKIGTSIAFLVKTKPANLTIKKLAGFEKGYTTQCYKTSSCRVENY